MTDYQHVWGQAEKKWSPIDFRGSQILTILTVCAWAGMVLFFVCGAFSLLTRTDGATIAMLFALALWLCAGISAIRIRRGRRRFLRVRC
jgi:hypothetical protein